MPYDSVDFVLVTALEEERDAVLRKLPNCQRLSPTNDDVRIYYRAELPVTLSGGKVGKYDVIVLQLLNMGRVQAATAVSDAIRRWKPRYVIMVGIAGGVAAKQVRVGDVLVSEQIVDYELQKSTAQGPEIRWQVYRADPRLLGASQNLSETDWLPLVQVPRTDGIKPRRFIGPIASGDKVIAFGSALEQYRQHWTTLLGVEMEAAGVATAAFQSAQPPGFFMVRGVSDVADENKGSADIEGWRPYACDLAAAYMVALLKTGPVPLRTDQKQAQLILVGDYEGFDSTRRTQVTQVLAGLLAIEPDEIRILLTTPGSIKLVLEMPTVAAYLLLQLWEQKHPELIALGVTSVIIDEYSEASTVGAGVQAMQGYNTVIATGATIQASQTIDTLGNESASNVPYNPRPGKFIVPSRLPDLLRRRRLLDFLHENIHRKLILIAAAAGYGKSSLLMDFAHDTDYPVAWYQLDDADSDLAALALGLVSALKRLYPNFQSVLPSLAARPGVNPDDLANAFNREIETTIDEYCVIVLDDFHLIEHSSQIIRFFDVLLAGLPEQAHFIISGRTLPPIRVVSLAARQQVAGLNEERLRFTVDEVKALVEARSKTTLADADADSLVSNTEGWITGILLSAQLMSHGSMSGMLLTRSGDSPVYDFLADEVLDRQPELLKRFLVESAVLPEMEPSVCDSVLGQADSDALLREAESRHLFVNAVGDEFRSYHYHHLFREFLLSRLRAQDPARLQALQVKAAEWYAANDMPEAAVTFYLLAGQTTEAAAIAERAAKAMYLSGRFATLQRWAEQLSSVAHDIPRVHLYLARLQREVDRLAAELTLDLAMQGFARRDDKVGRLDVDLTRAGWAYYTDGEIATAQSLAESCLAVSRELGTVVSESIALRYLGLCSTALGKFVEAESYLQEAVDLLEGTSHRFDLAATLDDLANILRLRGQTAQSARTQQLALATWRQVGAPGLLASALNNAGFDFYLLGQYESALATYQEALQWAQKAGNARIEATIQTGQGDVFADLGDEVLAADLYRQALAKAEKAGDKGLLAYLYRATARLNRAAGNLAAALEWLRRADLISGKLPSPLTNTEGLRGIILTEMGRIVDGRRVLEQACAGMARTGGMVDLAQTLFFFACSQFRDGDLEAAVASLSQALSIAEQVGYDQMLVVEALSGADMLDAFASRQAIGLQARSLLMRARNLGIIRERLTGSSAVPAPAQHAALEVRALGQSCVLKDGVEVSQTTWGSQRPRELFFFLVDRAPIARDVVLNTFWPEKSAAKAVNNLYQAMFRIRRALGYDVVLLEQGECKLSSVVALTYDARRFEAEAQGALALRLGDLRRLELLESAAALYMGEYLADLSVEWAAERRRSLCDLYVLVLREYADILMNLTRYNEARQALARALDVEPLRDDIHEKMLNCLAAMGRRHEVVDHYRRYRDTLRSELGIDPPTEMRALYGRLLG